MLKKLIQHIIRQKTPGFSFDEAVTSLVLRELMFQKLGMWLRGKRFMLRGRWISKLFLGRGVRLYNLPNMQFGKWVQLEEFVHVSALGKQPLSFGNNVKIGAYSRIITSITLGDLGSHIRIGNNVGIGEWASLGGAGGLDIGDDCIVGQYFSCHPENHVFEKPGLPIRLQGVTRQGISIGRNCWIGSKVTILDGVTIGDNCVIAAGAVVSRPMPSNSVIAGVPAKVIKTIAGPLPQVAEMQSTLQSLEQALEQA